MNYKLRQTLLPFLSLFTSVGTLLCCALPALLVSLGMGAVLAGLVSTVPGLVFLSERKDLVFSLAGVLLVVAGAARYYARNAPCPADPKLAAACARSRKLGAFLFWFSVLIYLVGAFFAFLADDLLL